MCLTLSVGAVLGVEGAFSENNLMSDDGKAVDVSFLRGALCPQMLRSSPQVWEEEENGECKKVMKGRNKTLREGRLYCYLCRNWGKCCSQSLWSSPPCDCLQHSWWTWGDRAPGCHLHGDKTCPAQRVYTREEEDERVWMRRIKWSVVFSDIYWLLEELQQVGTF